MKGGLMTRHVRLAKRTILIPLLLLGVLLANPDRALGADVKIVSVTNNTGAAAADLHVTFAGSGGNVTVVPATVIAPGGCPIPAVPSNPPAVTNTVVINWGVACVPNGATVTFVVSTVNGPLAFAGGNWTGAGGGNIGAIGAGDITVSDATGGAGTLNVPITATVRPPCGGAGAAAVIGTIAVSADGAADPDLMVGDFTFTPQYAWVDKWYDFRWINILVAWIQTDGTAAAAHPAVGTLPAIDPAPAGAGGNADDSKPFYYNNGATEWGSKGKGPGGSCAGQRIHEECVRSRFCDSRNTGQRTLVFKTFLVIDDVTAGQIGDTQFCVLAGFSWFLDGPSDTTGILNGPIAADPALINAALANANAPGFPGWMALGADNCPLQACPTPLEIECTSIGFDPLNPDCCLFNWTVTNNGPLPVNEFYLDLEAGTGGPCKDPRQPGPPPPVPAGDISLPGWTASYCYLWDNNPISNWAVICFMPDSPGQALQPGDTKRGTLSVRVNGPLKVDANFPDWHRFSIPPHSIHCHVTDYSPLCLGVNCGLGQFGPHIANDIHGRDQSCFWSAGGDWTWKPCPWDVNRDRFVNVLDLIDVLLCFGQPAAPDCGQEDINQDGTVNVLDLVQLLLHFGETCPQPPPPINNDNCFERRPITDGLRPFDTTLATTDGLPTNGLNDCAAFEDPQIHNDIWYNYFASCDGQLIVSTCNDGNPGTGEADYDTKIAIYDGCDLALCPFGGNEIGCNDDGPECAGLTSVAQAPVIAGNCYKIRVGGFGPTSAGTGVLSVQCIP